MDDDDASSCGVSCIASFSPISSAIVSSDDSMDRYYETSVKVEICGDVKKGVVKIKIQNIEDIFDLMLNENGPDYDWKIMENFHQCLRMKYHNLDNPNEEISKSIRWNIISEEGIFYLILPVTLHAYTFEFRLSVIDPPSGESINGFADSPTLSIAVPSFMNDAHFKIGDTVSFREIGSFQTTRADIVEILEDNMFGVKYWKFDAIKSRDGHPYPYTIQSTAAHISRIYHESTVPQHEVDLVHYDEINQLLLLQTKDDDAVNAFNAIQEALYEFAYSETIKMYGMDPLGIGNLLHCKGINEFMSLQIYQFLFAPQFKYAVDCLIEGDDHRALEMRNMRQSDIRTKYELMKNQIGNIRFRMSMHDHLCYSCDACQCAINEWEMVFQCTESKLTERHDYCKRCVGTVVMLNQGLTQLLWELLKEEMIYDCVSLIVNFVIGRVIYTEFDAVEESEEEDGFEKKGAKRGIEETYTPPSKRIKMKR